MEEKLHPTDGTGRLIVGLCQVLQTYSIQDNIKRSVDLVRRASAQGADVCVLPEMFLSPYEPIAIRQASASSRGALETLQDTAREEGVYIVAGSLPWPGLSGTKLLNRCHVVGPHGELVHHHDKIHLFDCNPPGGPRVVESETIAPGSRLGVFETPWGNAAVLVCYDIRFTPLVQILADKDVRILFVPAAFSSSTGKAHWEVLIRMRAVELQGFVVGVQPAVNHDLAYVPWGRSLVASPWGDVVVRADEAEGVLIAELDMAECERIRTRFPLLGHRRKDLYETVWKGGS